MNESGPIKRPIKTSGAAFEFSDLHPITHNVWRATLEGKYWILKTAEANDTASMVLLRREFELSRTLQHPFIASTFLFLEDSPVGPAIMMEYIEGQTLSDFVFTFPAERTRKKVFCQIADALEYIHQKGIVHNDIKPGNIMVGAIGNDVKIIDFGYAENASDYMNRGLGGTIGSSAPELLASGETGGSTAASDIYSLGGILRLLFPNKYKHISRKCLREKPENRYSDIASLRAAIARRDRRPVIITAFLVAAVLICAALIYDYNRQSIVKQELRQEVKQELREEVTEEVTQEVTQKVQTDVRKQVYSEIRQEIQQKEQHKIDSVNSVVSRIQHDMTVFYKEAADSMLNKSLSPYQEFALPKITVFVNRTVRYKEMAPKQEMQFICDTIYGRLLVNLYKIVRQKPNLYKAKSQGLISEEEYNFYSDLCSKKKPYTPYRPGLSSSTK